MSFDTPEKPGQQLTPAQQAALATDKNISVTAGAGSGKTTILVARYLKIILEDEVDVRRVLAITFTEKAAAEMTQRVAEMIQQRLGGKLSDEERSRLLALRERLNAAQISTIHAFCARILREFAVAAGVDPDFSVPSELQQRLFIRESLDEVLEQLDRRTLESDIDMADWLELLRQVPPPLLNHLLSALLSNRYETQRLQQHLAEMSDQAWLSRLENAFFGLLETRLRPATLLAELLPLLREILSATVHRAALKENGQKVFALAEEILLTAETRASQTLLWQKLLDLAPLLTAGKEGTPYKTLTALGKKADLGESHEPLLEISRLLNPLYHFSREFGETVPGPIDRLNLQAVRKIMRLYAEVEARYQEKKEARGLLDFDDLQLLALKMLQEHEGVRIQLRNRYRHVMVDEFQDTNALQWAIISQLGTPDGQLQPDKFFVVGDPKQSIYGFRNADVRVFQDVKTQFAHRAGAGENYPGNITLSDSFRFLPSINRFVNFLFARILGSDAENTFDVPYEALNTRREVEDRGHIELAVLDEEELGRENLSQEDYVAQQICALLNRATEGNAMASDAHLRIYHRRDGREELRPVRPGDIAILIRQRTTLPVLESKLRQYRVPFKTIGGVGFYSRQEIFDIYHLLRFLDNPGDNLALVALLRSPFAGISDAALFYLSLEPGAGYRDKLRNVTDFSRYPPGDREPLRVFRSQMERWQQRRDRLSLSRLISEILDEALYRATLAANWNGEQLLANLDKLVEQVRDFEQGGFMALSDYIDSLRETIRLEPREGEAQVALEDESTVKIMTIHQAKGLEFPIVFCPYLQQTPRGEPQPFRFDADLGLAVKIRDPENNYAERIPYLYQRIDQRMRQKEAAELKRLFYVAVTRARDRLYLVGSCKNGTLEKENCLRWAVEALGIAENLSSENPELTIRPAEGVRVRLVKKIAPVPLPDTAPGDIAPALRQLSGTIPAVTATPTTMQRLPTHLQPIDDQPRGVTFSATQLLTFQSDPQAYFLRYHQGFFESDYEFLTSFADPDSLSLLKGKIVHKILENGLPSHKTAILERLEAAFFQYEIFDPADQQDFRREITDLLLPFIQTQFAQNIFAAAESRAEISLTMRLGEDFLTGTLDRIFKNADGAWEVVDYKTNNVQTESEIKKAGEKYLIQMQAYALLMAQLYPEQPEFRVSLYFLKPQQTFARDYSRKNIRQIREKFTGLITQIKKLYPFGEQMY